MILPGTLVQYWFNQNPRLRPNGIYTVRATKVSLGDHCPVHGRFSDCDRVGLLLCEADPTPRGAATAYGWKSSGQFGSCAFRIIAPPITEADRLEASAPDAPAKPKRVRA